MLAVHKQFTDYELPAGQDYLAIHYLSHKKAVVWLASQTIVMFGEYHEWTELGQNHHSSTTKILSYQNRFTCLIYTSSDQIEQIET